MSLVSPGSRCFGALVHVGIPVSGVYARKYIPGGTPHTRQPFHRQRFQPDQLFFPHSFIAGDTSQLQQKLILFAIHKGILRQELVEECVQHARSRNERLGCTCRGLHFQLCQNLPHPVGMLRHKAAPGKNFGIRTKKSFRIIRRKARTGGIFATHVTGKGKKLRHVPCHQRVCQTILVHTLCFHTHHQLQPVVRNAAPCRLHPRSVLQDLQELRHTAVTFIHIQHGVPAPLLQISFGMTPFATPGYHQRGQFSL